ncbi:GNAT family N-acetyltransferase [Nocardia rhamnosiphila]|uniref:GNAT family N-acetyltransferase n=1 Tax=Nocardia rhamnosiphila TaxID=426716 RepID=UPI00340C3915
MPNRPASPYFPQDRHISARAPGCSLGAARIAARDAATRVYRLRDNHPMDLATVHVRQLQVAEWAVFRQIRLRSLVDAPHAFGSTLDEARRRGEGDWRELLVRRAQFLAAAVDTAVGTVGVTGDGGELHLISMWVAPEARGTGVADLLLHAVLDHATVRGDRIRLEVVEGNIAAERLYYRHGFRRTGVRGTVGGGDIRPEFEMVLDL